jgi:hypothetical protein
VPGDSCRPPSGDHRSIPGRSCGLRPGSEISCQLTSWGEVDADTAVLADREVELAHLLPRLIAGRERGPLFLSGHRPGPHRLATAEPRDICPETGRVRLGYDRARVLLAHYADGLRLHQLRHLGHPPRRGQRLRQRDHGQDRAQELAVGAALRQARPCCRPRSHRNAIEPTPTRLIRASRRHGSMAPAASHGKSTS